MDNIEKKVDEGFQSVLKRLDGLDEKFASKWVEEWLIWAGRIVVGAVIVALLGLVITNVK